MRFFIFLSLMFYCQSLLAAGPLSIVNNRAVKYNKNVVLNFDLGDLDSKNNNAKADALVNSAIDLWNSVSTSTMVISQGMDLDQDVNASNYTNYFPGRDNANNSALFSDGINPVVYDSDGLIIDDYFGQGQSRDIAGFATSAYSLSTGLYTEGYVVLNGSKGMSNIELQILVAHEVGHYIGLDHSQGNQSRSCIPPSDNYPLMYPIICRATPSLAADDIMSITALYPTATANSQLAIISGNLVDLANRPILGANLWFENLANNDVYSNISDYLMQRTGFFKVYLPPGNYQLHVQSLNAGFNDASSVGPYARLPNSLSFTDPHPITPAVYQDSQGNPVTIVATAGGLDSITFKLDNVESNVSTSLGNRQAAALSPVFLLLLLVIIRRKQIFYW